MRRGRVRAVRAGRLPSWTEASSIHPRRRVSVGAGLVHAHASVHPEAEDDQVEATQGLDLRRRDVRQAAAASPSSTSNARNLAGRRSSRSISCRRNWLSQRMGSLAGSPEVLVEQDDGAARHRPCRAPAAHPAAAHRSAPGSSRSAGRGRGPAARRSAPPARPSLRRPIGRGQHPTARRRRAVLTRRRRPGP